MIASGELQEIGWKPIAQARNAQPACGSPRFPMQK